MELANRLGSVANGVLVISYFVHFCRQFR